MRLVRDLNLAGLDTKELISLGSGYREWPLMDFKGPVFMAERITGRRYPMRLRLLLPEHLLRLLYARFAQANPSGCVMGTFEEIDQQLFAPEVSEEERERQYDAGEAEWDVFKDRLPPHGRDPIRRYLPELFDPAVLQEILDEPRLDADWNRTNQPEGDGYWDSRRHYRWSDWWNAAVPPPSWPPQPNPRLTEVLAGEGGHSPESANPGRQAYGLASRMRDWLVRRLRG